MGSVFKFSPTTTSASFVLRKHYFSLLYHYEQVHFFKMKGPLNTPTGMWFFFQCISLFLLHGCFLVFLSSVAEHCYLILPSLFPCGFM